MSDFRPMTSDDPDTPVSPPLSRAGTDWSLVDVDGRQCQRELNVMPQWAGSCWYYLRFIDPHNTTAFCDAQAERSFMPVDLYIGVQSMPCCICSMPDSGTRYCSISVM